MSLSGLLQVGLLVVVLIVLAVLVQMDGGVRRELAALKPPSISLPAFQPAQATTAAVGVTGVGIGGGAISRLGAATSNSMNQSAARLQQR